MADYNVVNPPQSASYAAPLLSFESFGDLPEQYFKGTQRRRTLELQKPIIDPATGQPSFDTGRVTIDPRTGQPVFDPGMVARGLAERGGAEYQGQTVQQFLPYMIASQIGQGAANNFDATGVSQNNPNAAGSSSIAPPVTRAPTAPERPTSTSGVNIQPGSTFALVTEALGPGNETIARNYAKWLGVDAAIPLSPDKAEALKSRLGVTKLKMASAGGISGTEGVFPGDTRGPGATTSQDMGGSAGGSPTSKTGDPYGSGESGDTGAQIPTEKGPAPVFGGGPASGGPGPVAGAGQPQGEQRTVQAGGPSVTGGGRPATATAQRFQPPPQAQVAAAIASAPPGGAAAAIVPRGVRDPTAYANELTRQAIKLSALPNVGKTLAEPIEAYAKQIREAIAKDAELTGPQKEARTLGLTTTQYAGAQESAKKDSEAFQKEYTAANTAATQAAISIPKAQLLKSLTDNLDFYSGPLEPTNRLTKQFASTFGLNPNRAVPQETFNKLASDMLTDQIRGLAGSGVGRIMLAEVQTMKSSIASLGITPATNRVLAEILLRTHQHSIEIGKIAQQHQKEGVPGNMSPGFDAAVQDYLKKNPIFSKEELKDPLRIAPPVVRGRTEAEFRANLNRIGWKDGMPFATEDGRIFTHAGQ